MCMRNFAVLGKAFILIAYLTQVSAVLIMSLIIVILLLSTGLSWFLESKMVDNAYLYTIMRKLLQNSISYGFSQPFCIKKLID